MSVRRTREFLGSLAFRLLALLSLALMPIGAIAIYQTSQVAEQLREREKSALLADTVAAVAGEKGVVDRAFGAAEVAGALTRPALGDLDLCKRRLREFIDRTALYVYAGILPRDGIMDCSSADTVIDASGDEMVKFRFTAGVPFVDVIERGAVSQQAVMIIGQPVYIDNTLSHFVVLSLPRARFQARQEALNGALSVVTFSTSGDVLSADLTPEELHAALPASHKLGPMGEATGGLVFRDRTQAGEDRIFSVVPIHRGVVYAIASWPPDRLVLSETASLYSPWLFPLVMWLATLSVTYVAINLLVVRHVRALGTRMRRFARNRVMGDTAPTPGQPAEFVEMNEDFLAMADAIVRDEADLENALREKNLLIREVHHRVKNNLQLIASIMNMQIRRSRSSETSDVVRRLQERVLGLATVHRQMYRSESMSQVPIDELLADIMDQALRGVPAGHVETSRSFVPLSLVPDQAVPLALLMAEAMNNATAYVGASEGQPARIRVDLVRRDDRHFRLEIENTLPPEADVPDLFAASSQQGLGAQLIRAFATQLGGTIEAGRDGAVYRLRMDFEAKKDDTVADSQFYAA